MNLQNFENLRWYCEASRASTPQGYQGYPSRQVWHRKVPIHYNAPTAHIGLVENAEGKSTGKHGFTMLYHGLPIIGVSMGFL